MIDNFKIGDNITFPTFISTTCANFIDSNFMDCYTSKYSTSVIFKITIPCNLINNKKFIFVESHSEWPTDREVILVPSVFKITNRYFATLKDNNNCKYQKLVFELVLVNENPDTMMVLPDFMDLDSFFAIINAIKNRIFSIKLETPIINLKVVLKPGRWALFWA
jgi:hypothetical protein